MLDSTQLMVLLLNATTSKVLYTLIGTLVKIAYHIGAEATTEKLVPYLDQFFSHYSHMQTGDTSGTDNIYTPEMAAMLYYQFAILIGKDKLDEEISNVHKIQEVMKQDKRLNMYYQNLDSDDFTPVRSATVKHENSPKGKIERILDSSKEELRPKNIAMDPNWLLNSISENGPSHTWNGLVIPLLALLCLILV